MGYENLQKMGAHILEKKEAKPKWTEQSMTNKKITFSRDNFKTNAGRVKNIVVKGAHGFQKGANYLGKTFPGLKDQNTMNAIYGGGGSSHKQHHQHHKHHSNEQHIYIHHVQSSGHRKKRRTTSQSNPFDFRF